MDSAVRADSRRRREGEEGEEFHQNPFISSVTSFSSTSKLQSRTEVSTARWDDELWMGEVVEKKGSMWVTTGIVRNGKLYCHIEEILFLAERGALILSDSNGTILSIMDIYRKIAEERDGFSWESFEVYRHLKLLGYIMGRHGVPWTMKSTANFCNSESLQSKCHNDRISNRKGEEATPIIHLFEDMQLNEARPTFDVHQPNSKFRKSSPGDPSFVLCLLRENPPLGKEVESLERKCNGIPLKYCFVDHGRIVQLSQGGARKSTSLVSAGQQLGVSCVVAVSIVVVVYWMWPLLIILQSVKTQPLFLLLQKLAVPHLLSWLLSGEGLPKLERAGQRNEGPCLECLRSYPF